MWYKLSHVVLYQLRQYIMLLLLWVMCTRWSQNGINGRQAVRIKFTSMALALLCFLYIKFSSFWPWSSSERPLGERIFQAAALFNYHHCHGNHDF
jgi:hypothetical protein